MTRVGCSFLLYLTLRSPPFARRFLPLPLRRRKQVGVASPSDPSALSASDKKLKIPPFKHLLVVVGSHEGE